MSGEYNSSTQRTSPWVTAGRVIFTLALIGCIAFIFSNSMKIASVSTVSSSRVLTLLQAALRRLGHPALAQRLTDHIVRKLAHFCEYMLEGFLLMLCMRVYTRQYIWHISVPMLGGVLTALTDETIQIFRPDAAVRSPMCGWIQPVFWRASLRRWCSWRCADCCSTIVIRSNQ